MSYKYKRIKLKDGTTRDEHRIVMEAHLGRKLKRSEIVHHKDGNGKNNKIENLELMSLSKHTSMHKKGVKKPPISEETRKKISESCKGRGRILTDEDVKKAKILRDGGMSLRTLGKIFKVNKETMRIELINFSQIAQ